MLSFLVQKMWSADSYRALLVREVRDSQKIGVQGPSFQSSPIQPGSILQKEPKTHRGEAMPKASGGAERSQNLGGTPKDADLLGDARCAFRGFCSLPSLLLYQT